MENKAVEIEATDLDNYQEFWEEKEVTSPTEVAKTGDSDAEHAGPAPSTPGNELKFGQKG